MTAQWPIDADRIRQPRYIHSDAIMTAHPSSSSSQADLLNEAAHWALTQQFDTFGEKDREAFVRWYRQSPAHAQAWEHAQAVLQTFRQLPADIGKDAIQALSSMKRRHLLRTLCTAGVLIPSGLLLAYRMPWQSWTADMATATGEIGSFTLADGTELVLNTASAVDVAFTASERRLRLRRGEILVRTHPDQQTPSRPFLVESSHGLIQAMGTRFSVRNLSNESTLVAVLEHAVSIQPSEMDQAELLIISAGWQTTFTRSGIATPSRLENSAAYWENHMLVAQNMRLADVLQELGRYHKGVLRCHPDVADLRVSGAIKLTNTDAALELLQRHFPLRVTRMTRYWISVEAA